MVDGAALARILSSNFALHFSSVSLPLGPRGRRFGAQLLVLIHSVHLLSQRAYVHKAAVLLSINSIYHYMNFNAVNSPR